MFLNIRTAKPLNVCTLAKENCNGIFFLTAATSQKTLLIQHLTILLVG